MCGNWIKDHKGVLEGVAALGLGGAGLGALGVGPLAGLLGSASVAGAMPAVGAASAVDAGLGGMGEMAGGLATSEGAAGNSLLGTSLRSAGQKFGSLGLAKQLALASRASGLLNPAPIPGPQMPRGGAAPIAPPSLPYGPSAQMDPDTLRKLLAQLQGSSYG